MADYIDRAYLEIDGRTIDCSSLEESTTDGTAPVPTMNAQNRSKGYTGGVPEYRFTATVPIPEGGLPVNFDRLKRRKTRFGAVILEESGDRIVFVDCRIADVSRKYAQGEASEYSLECMALDRV